jgi:hypothetical protein
MKIQQRMQMLILMIWLYMLPITMAESMKIQYICKDQWSQFDFIFNLAELVKF